MSKYACSALLVVLLLSCAAPKATVPALTPDAAAELLHYNSKAETWMVYVRKHNASCEYRVDLPDQTTHPTEIDVEHIVYCGGRPSSREYDASVSFEYDPTTQHWKILRFSS